MELKILFNFAVFKERTTDPAVTGGIKQIIMEAIVYKQGLNWISNIGGYLTQLPYWVKTKKQVKEYLSDYNVIFAKK